MKNIDEIFRLYGIETTLTGAAHLRKLVSGQMMVKDLSYEQIKQVLAAWDTRNFVPANKLGTVDKIIPKITKEDVITKNHTQEEHDRSQVEAIIEYLKEQL